MQNDDFLEKDGFLPINEELNETMHTCQEEVESHPKRYIIEECIPACQELWSKNIYTYMASDHDNEGECWVTIEWRNLSDENKRIYESIYGEYTNDNDSYYTGNIKLVVNDVGTIGQKKLLDLARQFKMQDVPEVYAYKNEKDYLMYNCGCYDEVENPNYRYMAAPWDSDINIEDIHKYMLEYEKWKNSDDSKQTIMRYAPEKATKSVAEYAIEHGHIYENGRVYLSQFDYKKHLKYLQYIVSSSNDFASDINMQSKFHL